MLRKYLLPALALAGFLFGIITVVQGNQPQPPSQPVVQPPAAPFASFIAGAGIVEARNRNIQIGTPLSGVVTEVAVKVGDRVKAGDLLFRLDDRQYLAQEALAQAAVSHARAQLNDASTQLRLAQSITDRRAISTEELERRRNAVAIAKAQVDQAEAQLGAARTDLDRILIRAPADGEVLQANVRPGEFAAAGSQADPPMVLGNLDQLHVRVDIDENDAWRFRRDARAMANLRGNPKFKAELTLAYVEPYVVPKRSLTGDSAERVDTRVLQALYSFDPAKLPAYVGQQMDVYIEAPPADGEEGR
ncbi:efflux RND transporter periplasmic adaptor subunit [Methylogaea oryzae]|uniref:Hemolysin secretion protein D n=1 Tax=Methylogaea oryzae TaxID=1295382 RepID=A0A8D4VU12_9GAMM|nr:efflux RND transporter periplasmic adaptor subunit [Methylogaea oryzae]BBL72627.1 hemolysin secretion protein D [Methylogaea oryzae]